MVKEVMTKKKMSKTELDEALIANFINLQKVLTNLSVRFDELSNNITKLLQLFEISAKSFAEKYEQPGATGATGTSEQIDKDFLKKLDALLDQNKTIAKGIMLMEEKVRDRINPQQQNQPSQQIQPSDRFRDIRQPRY
jgi:hypothetical protein